MRVALVNVFVALCLYLDPTNAGQFVRNDPTFAVNMKKPLHVVSDRFLSITIDPNTILQMTQCEKSEAAVNMASGLSPAFFRIAGPESNSYTFKASPETSQSMFPEIVSSGTEMKNNTMSGAQWIWLNNFASESGLDLVAALNGVTQNGYPSWDLSNALELITFSDKFNYDLVWQIGYELQRGGNNRGKELGRDVTRLRKILEAFPRYHESPILGPDMVSLQTKEDALFVKDYLTEAGDSLNAFTWHPNFSSLKEGDDPYNMMSNTLTLMDNYIWTKDAALKPLLKYPPKKPIWLAESESKTKDANFSDAMQFVQRLGAAAKLGVSVYLRKPHVLTLYEPTPEYWVALLHKALVGNIVLDIRSMGSNNSRVQIFSHCTQTWQRPELGVVNPNVAYQRGSVTLFGINDSEERSKISVKTSTRDDETAHAYIITSSMDTMNPHKVKLNGQEATLSENKQLPMFSPKIRSSYSLVLPPKSIFFVVLPESNAKVCVSPTIDQIADIMSKQRKAAHAEETSESSKIFDKLEEAEKDSVYVSFPDRNAKAAEPESIPSPKFDQPRIPKRKMKYKSETEEPYVKYVTFTDDQWLSSFPQKLKDGEYNIKIEEETPLSGDEASTEISDESSNASEKLYRKLDDLKDGESLLGKSNPLIQFKSEKVHNIRDRLGRFQPEKFNSKRDISSVNNDSFSEITDSARISVNQNSENHLSTKSSESDFVVDMPSTPEGLSLSSVHESIEQDSREASKVETLQDSQEATKVKALPDSREASEAPKVEALEVSSKAPEESVTESDENNSDDVLVGLTRQVFSPNFDFESEDWLRNLRGINKNEKISQITVKKHPSQSILKKPEERQSKTQTQNELQAKIEKLRSDIQMMKESRAKKIDEMRSKISDVKNKHLQLASVKSASDDDRTDTVPKIVSPFKKNGDRKSTPRRFKDENVSSPQISISNNTNISSESTPEIRVRRDTTSTDLPANLLTIHDKVHHPVHEHVRVNHPIHEHLPTVIVPRDHIPIKVPSRDHAPLNIPSRDHAPVNIPSRDHTPVNIPSRDHVPVINLPSRDHAPVNIPSRDHSHASPSHNFSHSKTQPSKTEEEIREKAREEARISEAKITEAKIAEALKAYDDKLKELQNKYRQKVEELVKMLSEKATEIKQKLDSEHPVAGRKKRDVTSTEDNGEVLQKTRTTYQKTPKIGQKKNSKSNSELTIEKILQHIKQEREKIAQERAKIAQEYRNRREQMNSKPKNTSKTSTYHSRYARSVLNKKSNVVEDIESQLQNIAEKIRSLKEERINRRREKVKIILPRSRNFRRKRDTNALEDLYIKSKDKIEEFFDDIHKQGKEKFPRMTGTLEDWYKTIKQKMEEIKEQVTMRKMQLQKKLEERRSQARNGDANFSLISIKHELNKREINANSVENYLSNEKEIIKNKISDLLDEAREILKSENIFAPEITNSYNNDREPMPKNREITFEKYSPSEMRYKRGLNDDAPITNELNEIENEGEYNRDADEYDWDKLIASSTTTEKIIPPKIETDDFSKKTDDKNDIFSSPETTTKSETFQNQQESKTDEESEGNFLTRILRHVRFLLSFLHLMVGQI